MAKELPFLCFRSSANDYLSQYEPIAVVLFSSLLSFLLYRFLPSVLSLLASAIKLILGVIPGYFGAEEQKAMDELKFRDKCRRESSFCSRRSEFPERHGRSRPAPMKTQRWNTINGEEIRISRRSPEGRRLGRNRGRSCSDDDDGELLGRHGRSKP
ncbi:uncharacterized protein [Typha angustifolia]|uniref:uncharacterized protein n=1 Tax=Typha angustifolia TaxID=59011 RepID=UPI003C2AF04E